MTIAGLDPTAGRIITGYSDQVGAVRERVATFVRLRWSLLHAYHDTDIDRFVAALVPVVAGGQRQIAALTDSYLATIATAVLGTPTRPVGIPAGVVTTEAMRGVPAVDVYRRAGVSVWSALARGVDLDTSAGFGLARALVMSGTDLQLARTHATRYALERGSDRIIGYARVPEADPCELCDLASTQTYRIEDLMPIHDRCQCDVEPIYDDTPRDVDPDAAAAFADRVDVVEHGELGPVLVAAGTKFSGPDDI